MRTVEECVASLTAVLSQSSSVHSPAVRRPSPRLHPFPFAEIVVKTLAADFLHYLAACVSSRATASFASFSSSFLPKAILIGVSACAAFKALVDVLRALPGNSGPIGGAVGEKLGKIKPKPFPGRLKVHIQAAEKAGVVVTTNFHKNSATVRLSSRYSRSSFPSSPLLRTKLTSDLRAV